MDSIIQKIHALATKDHIDFDKYEALSLAQALTYCAQDTHHKSAGFYRAALQEIRTRLDRPQMEFKAFFINLFADKEYTKVLEYVTKVEKALRVPFPTKTSLTRNPPPRC